MPIAQIIALAPTLISAGSDLWKYIKSIKEAAQKTGEWTPEAEAEYAARIKEASEAPHWQPENPPQ